MSKYITDILDYIRLNPVRFIIRMLLLISAFLFVFGDFGLVTRLSMELENRQLEHRLAEEQKRVIALDRTIRNAYQADSVEKVARERYNFRRQGETVFIIKEE